MYFVDRGDAGRRLAARLLARRGPEVVVVAAARAGVPVAAEVARVLGVPLDLLDDDGGVPGRSGSPWAGRTVVVVDEGLLTGATARAACRAARHAGAAHVVLAVPVAPAGWAERLGDTADEYVCVAAPVDLPRIAAAYHDATVVSDDEVRACLDGAHPRGPLPTTTEADVVVRACGRALPGRLHVPERAIGVVVFAHGPGSSHASPRNRLMAAALNEARVATLLVDLLADDEAGDRSLGADIARLGERIVGITRWVLGQPGLGGLPVGYVGASTGAPAAFWAVTEGGVDAVGVVSRGGRADLAQEWLGRVRCPTLLIVGAEDDQVLALNREAVRQLHGQVRLAVVPGASHFFTEPGALDTVAALARDALVRWLVRAQRSLEASTPAASSAAMRSSS